MGKRTIVCNVSVVVLHIQRTGKVYIIDDGVQIHGIYRRDNTGTIQHIVDTLARMTNVYTIQTVDNFLTV